jgi:hypothetical protein
MNHYTSNIKQLKGTLFFKYIDHDCIYAKRQIIPDQFPMANMLIFFQIFKKNANGTEICNIKTDIEFILLWYQTDVLKIFKSKNADEMHHY